MIENNKWAYISFTTYTDDRGYEQVKEYTLYYDTKYVVNCSFTTILQHLPLSNICIFMKDLSLFYQINYNEILPKIRRDKKHNFRGKYKPLYFYIGNRFYKDLNALEINNIHELKQFLSKYEHLSQVPNTLAGIVRQDLKYIMLGSLKYDLPKINNEKYVDVLEKAYIGGDIGIRFDDEFTKEKMYSFDITSSYPAVLYYMKYPLGNWKKYDGKYYELFKYKGELNNEYLITVTFNNIRCIGLNASISQKLIVDGDNVIIEDERLERANKVTITCTSLDLEILNKWYTYDSYSVIAFYKNNKWAYLPRLLRDKIKEYYYDKENSDDPINKKKLNIIYGIFCNGKTDYGFEFDDNEFEYNDTINPFPFSVGVFCSAYARKRLNDLLFDLKDSACYWDTDCIKGSIDNMDKVYEIVEKHNKSMRKLYNKEDEWLLGQWKDEGIHDIILIGKKQYIKDGIAKISGADCKQYTNCDENTIFKNAIKHVTMYPQGVKITYSDKIIKEIIL